MCHDKLSTYQRHRASKTCSSDIVAIHALCLGSLVLVNLITFLVRFMMLKLIEDTLSEMASCWCSMHSLKSGGLRSPEKSGKLKILYSSPASLSESIQFVILDAHQCNFEANALVEISWVEDGSD